MGYHLGLFTSSWESPFAVGWLVLSLRFPTSALDFSCRVCGGGPCRLGPVGSKSSLVVERKKRRRGRAPVDTRLDLLTHWAGFALPGSLLYLPPMPTPSALLPIMKKLGPHPAGTGRGPNVTVEVRRRGKKESTKSTRTLGDDATSR